MASSRDLGRRSGNSPASAPRRAARSASIVDLDPSVSPTPGRRKDASPLAARRGREASNGASQTHEQRLGLKADFERIREFFDEEFERDGARGYAVFCAGPRQPLADACRSASRCRTRSRSAASSTWLRSSRSSAEVTGAVVAVVCREQGRLYRLRAGRLEEVADLFEEQPRRHDQGGWSQARFQRHVDELAQGPPEGGRRGAREAAAPAPLPQRRRHLPGGDEERVRGRARRPTRGARSSAGRRRRRTPRPAELLRASRCPCSRSGGSARRRETRRALEGGGRPERARRVRLGGDARGGVGRARRVPPLRGRRRAPGVRCALPAGG